MSARRISATLRASKTARKTYALTLLLNSNPVAPLDRGSIRTWMVDVADHGIYPAGTILNIRTRRWAISARAGIQRIGRRNSRQSLKPTAPNSQTTPAWVSDLG